MKPIYALIVIGIVLALVGGGGGAAILILGHGHDEITQPMWKMGQYWMFQGILNFAVFALIFFFARKLKP